MMVIDDLTKANLQHDTILTIGAFDGLHCGHRLLIQRIVQRARDANRLAGLVTFHPHPTAILAPERTPRYLTTPGEKVALLEGMGIDLVVLLPFNREVAAMTSRAFMTDLSRHLRVREVWVGSDFALGRNREGNTDRLSELGLELGYKLHVVDPVSFGTANVSSSRIRTLVAEGRVADAARLLGRFHRLSGEVVSGARRGRGLGFPTANLEVRPERAVPANGVYAVFAVLGTERYPAVANVGIRPSFDSGNRTIETHIFDFSKDVYGCDLVVEFVERLRDERRFEHIDDLVAQIQQDSAAARRILDRAMGEYQGMNGALEPCGYRYVEIEHMADRSLRVWGGGLADLFSGAARGMYSLMADLGGLVPTEWHEIKLEGLDRESLLVDWLNELLYLTETEAVLFSEFQIHILTSTQLIARAGGVKSPITRAHIKAATYHDLALVLEEAGWSTVITFDV